MIIFGLLFISFVSGFGYDIEDEFLFGYDNLLEDPVFGYDTPQVEGKESVKVIYINYIQTHEDNLASNPANSEFSDNTYATFDKDSDPLYRIQGSHDGTNLGLIINVEVFIEYYTVDIDNDYAIATFYNPDFGTKYSISLRRIEAREEEGIQYEGRSWSYGFPSWAYFASPNLRGKIVSYTKVGNPDKGIFYIDKIGYKITYIE